MQVRRSEIQQENFVVLISEISLVFPPDANGQEIDDLDVDLSIFTNNEDDHLVRIIFVIKAKRTHADRPGIDIEVHASADFKIDTSLDAGSPEFQQLVNYSATAISYNNVRAYLQNIISYYPVELYILPTIDLNDLCKKHYENLNQKTKE